MYRHWYFINPLDEAAKENIWYSDHKKTEDRWEVVIHGNSVTTKALDKVISKDADLNKRLVGLSTTVGM